MPGARSPSGTARPWCVFHDPGGREAHPKVVERTRHLTGSSGLGVWWRERAGGGWGARVLTARSAGPRPASAWTAQPYLDRLALLGPSVPAWTVLDAVSGGPSRQTRSVQANGVQLENRGPTRGQDGHGHRAPRTSPPASAPGTLQGRPQAETNQLFPGSRRGAGRGRMGACPPGGRPPAPAPVRVGPKCPRSAQTAPALPPAAGRALESCGFSIGPRGYRRPLCRTRTPPQAPGPTPPTPHHANSTHHTPTTPSYQKNPQTTYITRPSAA